jgi:hypothetical protein
MRKLIPLIAVSFCLAGCVTGYQIQVFSDEIEALPYTYETKMVGDQTVTKRVSEGLFTAHDYESALVKAKEAGYTRVLSVEYYTTHYFALIWFVGVKWVTIRCTKEPAAALPPEIPAVGAE